MVDEKGRLVDFNTAAQKTFAWLNTSNIGTDISLFYEGGLILNKKTNEFTIEAIKNGEKRYYEFYITKIKQKEGILGEIYIFQDITKHKELLNRLSDMANIDPLTELFNRRKFMEQAHIEVSKAKRYARNISALMIDIDDFKKINDKFGHLAGDKVLSIISKECKKRLRESDIIARYGGEEFVVILIETDIQKAFIVAESIRQRISSLRIRYEGHIIKATVSIGISTKHIKDKDLTLYDLIDSADKALYKAKNSGKNIVLTENEISA